MEVKEKRINALTDDNSEATERLLALPTSLPFAKRLAFKSRSSFTLGFSGSLSFVIFPLIPHSDIVGSLLLFRMHRVAEVLLPFLPEKQPA